MNIFALDDSPYRSAVWQHDKHVVKMTLESAQLVSAVLKYHRPEWLLEIPERLSKRLYRPTHVHHPSTKWAAQNLSNFKWLCDHGMFLAGEYTYRFGRRHKSEAVTAVGAYYTRNVTFDELTPFATAMPDKYRIAGDPVLSYRYYYVSEKVMDDSKWSGGRRPDLPFFLFNAFWGK